MPKRSHQNAREEKRQKFIIGVCKSENKVRKEPASFSSKPVLALEHGLWGRGAAALLGLAEDPPVQPRAILRQAYVHPGASSEGMSV